MTVILVPFGHFWKFLVFWTFESFGLLVMTDTLYMWSVWTLLVTFKTLDNGAQVKGSLTFVVACMNKIFEFCGVSARPRLVWFRDWKSNHLLLRFDFNWVSAQFNLVWVKLRVEINLLVIWTWYVLSLWVTQCGCLGPFGHTGHFGPLFGIWYTLSHMDTVGHFGHTFGLVWQSSLNLIIDGSRHDRVYLIKSWSFRIESLDCQIKAGPVGECHRGNNVS